MAQLRPVVLDVRKPLDQRLGGLALVQRRRFLAEQLRQVGVFGHSLVGDAAHHQQQDALVPHDFLGPGGVS